jgi:hypothetical protein
MEKIDLKYDILYIHNDRYEFMKKSKKPLLKILSDIFIVKESWAFIIILFYALMIFILNIQMEIRYFLYLIMPIIALLILRYYYHYKDVVIQKKSTQNFQVNKDKLIIYYYKNNTKGLVTKIVTLPDKKNDIIDKLDIEASLMPNLNQTRFYKVNLFIIIVCIIISLIFLFVLFI